MLPEEELTRNLCSQNSLPIIWATSSFSCGVSLTTSWRLPLTLWSTSFTLLLFSWVMWRGTSSPGCDAWVLICRAPGGNKQVEIVRGVLRSGVDICEWVDLGGKAKF